MKVKSFADFYKEEVPVNATGPAVDMNPTGGRRSRLFNKIDRRSRWDINKMYKKAKGTK
jgi:hypothetical protein